MPTTACSQGKQLLLLSQHPWERPSLPTVQAFLASPQPNLLCKNRVCAKQKVSSTFLISQAAWSPESWEYCPGSPASPNPSTHLIPEAPRDPILLKKLDSPQKALQEAFEPQNTSWSSKTSELHSKFHSISIYSGPP